jgi:hypothetical protein
MDLFADLLRLFVRARKIACLALFRKDYVALSLVSGYDFPDSPEV